MKRRLASAALPLAVIVMAALVAVAVGDTHRSASDGDPYRVTPLRLIRELDKAQGVDVRFTKPSGEPVRTIAGVGSSGGVAIAFEFQLYPTSDEATVEQLGRLKPRDFGWTGGRWVEWEPRLRGVLANVAYAQYERRHIYVENHETVSEYLHDDASRRRVQRALDDALFDVFPASDSFAHPAPQRTVQ